MKRVLYVVADGEKTAIAYAPGQTVAQAVYADGRFPAPALCSGLGRCGACRVRVLGDQGAGNGDVAEVGDVERRLLGQADIDAGWRLGCRLAPWPGLCVELPPLRRPGLLVSPGRLELPLRLAVDLGTTSLHWAAYAGDAVVSRAAELNPQLGAGSEIMSRLAFAADPQQARALRRLVLDRLHAACALLEAPGNVLDELCVAGNPAMLAILLGRPLQGLSSAPYRLDFRGHETMALGADLGYTLPPAYIPPLFSPFVGADLAAGLAWIRFGLAQSPCWPFLLADLGTNGECILALAPDRYLATSVAMGPALEGIGLSCGTVAGPGAAVGFTLAPHGLVARMFQESGPGAHAAVATSGRITGAGYLALLALLRQVGVLDRAGHFFLAETDSRLSPLARRLARDIVSVDGEARLRLPCLSGDAYLSAADVEGLLKVKAAFNVAIATLLDAAGLGSHQLDRIYLAGALGRHAGAPQLEALGFFPAGTAARVSVLGNSSLAGAGLFLTRPETRDWAASVAKVLTTIDLAGAPRFGERFIERMVFDYVP